MRAEALAMAIRRTRFCLLDGAASLVPFLDCIGQVGRDNVEKVEILWDFGGGPQEPQQLQQPHIAFEVSGEHLRGALKGCKRLRRVSMTFKNLGWYFLALRDTCNGWFNI
jgi:hypothetical protein